MEPQIPGASQKGECVDNNGVEWTQDGGTTREEEAEAHVTEKLGLKRGGDEIQWGKREQYLK